MAAAANITLLNNAGANVTYAPVIIKTGEYARYVDRTQGVLNLQSTAALALKETKTNRIVTGVVVFPVLNATTGIVELDFFRIEASTHLSHTATDRLDLHKRGNSFGTNAVFTAAVENGETPW